MTKRYARKDGNTVDCASCHPFLVQENSEKQKIIFKFITDKNTNNTQLKFCQEVYIVNNQNEFLCSNPNGEVMLEKIESNNEFE